MKSVLFCVAALLWQLAFAAAPEVRNVKAMQQYPWGKVYIGYDVIGDVAAASPDKKAALKIVAADRVTGKTYKADARALSGDIDVSEGMHNVVWDISMQGIKLNSEYVSLIVAYEWNPLYVEIDVSSGANASSYPVTYLTERKGSYRLSNKLLFRRIEPGSIPTRNATITKPFYIGVYEVTQGQYEKVMGSNPSCWKDGDLGSARPVERVSYKMIRGSSKGAQWPASSEVDADSFIGRLRAKTGIAELDLPTEAQWEYACRAGTTSDYNNGGSSESSLNNLGRYYGNYEEGSLSYVHEHTIVGCYQPNAWGLYDMHGNVSEWCLDWFSSSGILSGDDPCGPLSGTHRVTRGGSYCNTAAGCTSSARKEMTPGDVINDCGFRIAIRVTE